MLREIKLTMNKTQAEINREWDVIVPARDAQQRSGDVSFLRVLRPWIGSAVRDARCILDVGCGSGRLTQTLRAAGARVVGVDPSPRSIDRKSTRLNSSHVAITYAVFCLKKRISTTY